MDVQESSSVNILPESQHGLICAFSKSYLHDNPGLAAVTSVFSLWLSIPAGQEAVWPPMTVLLGFTSLLSDRDTLCQILTGLLVWL